MGETLQTRNQSELPCISCTETLEYSRTYRPVGGIRPAEIGRLSRGIRGSDTGNCTLHHHFFCLSSIPGNAGPVHARMNGRVSASGSEREGVKAE